nr:MAG TPA_asm: minor tail protein [Caudoviricetes sp.]
MYDKMLQDYSEGQGSAMQEAEKSASNVTGSLNKLSNTWTKTINNLVNSDDMITFINLLEKVVSLVDKITDNLGLLGTGGLLTSAIAGAKGKGLTNVTYHSLRVPYCI